jgi:hypothetical protein
MKVIRLNENVFYLGYCKTDQMYHFITKDRDIEAYSKVKVVDCGVNDVYYCGLYGRITLRFKPVSESQLKSIINTPEKEALVNRYQKSRSEINKLVFAQ